MNFILFIAIGLIYILPFSYSGKILSITIGGDNPDKEWTVTEETLDKDFLKKVCPPPSGQRWNIYHSETKSCYPILSQGPCSSGWILDAKNQTDSTCIQNPCHRENAALFEKYGASTGQIEFLKDDYSKECIRLDTSCGNSGLTFKFELGLNVYPHCVSPYIFH